jgi:hypothetical protein
MHESKRIKRIFIPPLFYNGSGFGPIMESAGSTARDCGYSQQGLCARAVIKTSNGKSFPVGPNILTNKPLSGGFVYNRMKPGRGSN